MSGKKMLNWILVLAVLLTIFGCSPAESTPSTARNVIILIGDGMGFSQLELTRRYSIHVLGHDLRIAEVGSSGALAYVTTYSASNIVTDSAAAATAMATGNKTNNAMIGVTPDETPVTSILEIARDAGKRTGVISTMRVTHATPAAFSAHIVDRNDENAIAIQMLDAGLDVIFGGGRRNWIAQSVDGSRRGDDRDLVGEAQGAGYAVLTSVDELEALDASTTSQALGLFTSSHMSYDLDRDPAEEPSLAEMTSAAIQILGQGDEGFFLMVESGRIDLAGHYADAAALVHEVLAFDQAVGVALDYQAEHPDTLVIVTADHETGGVAFIATRDREEDHAVYMTVDDLEFISEIDTSLEALFGELSGADENTLETIFEPHTNIDLTEDEIDAILEAFANAVAPEHFGQMEMGLALADETSVTFATGEHTGEPVVFMALGPGSEDIPGMIDNVDIFDIVYRAFGFGE